MKEKGSSLEELSLSSKIILLDCSVLFGTFEYTSNKNITNTLDIKRVYHAQEALSYFTRKTETVSNLLLTKDIQNELKNFSFVSHYPKRKFKRDNQNRAYIERDFLEEKRKFLERMCFQGNILTLSKKELQEYNETHSKYLERKKKYHLSEPDYTLAISALICAKGKCKTYLISKDKGIKKIWYDFLNLESFGKNIGFFNHVSLGNFKKPN